MIDKQEPVAWMHKQGNYEEPSFRQLDDWEISNGWKQYPLYTTPQQRKPLTDEEIDKAMAENKQTLIDTADNYLKMRRAYARIIEAAHGIKE